MRLTRLGPWMGLLALSCKLDNPAFESTDELAGDPGTAESIDTDEVNDESGDQDGSSSSDDADGSSVSSDDATSTSDDNPSTSDDNSSSSSSDDNSTSESSTSEESSSTSEESSSDTLDTLDDNPDPLDGPIMACPIVDQIFDCKTCVQAHCCFDEDDFNCLDGTDVNCSCVLDCLIDTKAMVNCKMACNADDLSSMHANSMWVCAQNQCEQWCL